MNVYLYNFQKRRNSTGRPSIPENPTVICKLKDGCSIAKPVLEISSTISGLNTLSNTNYAYIPDFERYYFITDWVLTGTIGVAYLVSDPLASFKTNILTQQLYVLRASANYDGFIRDTKYPVKAAYPSIGTIYDMRANPLQPAAQSYGCFVIGVVGKGTTFGSVDYYAMSYLVFMQLMNKLFNLTTQWADGGADLADGLKKAITDPMQYIVSCMWYPYSVNDFVTRGLVSNVTDITIGYDTIALGVTAYRFNTILNIEFTNLISCQTPRHPLEGSRGNYMNYEPFARYYVSFYPFCSLIELDSTLLSATTDFVYTVDLRTGKGILSICPDHTGDTWADWRPLRPFRVIEAQVGVDIPVAVIQTAKPSSVGEYIQNTAVAAATEFGSPAAILKKAYSSLVQGVGNLIGSSDEELQQYYNEIGETPLNAGDLGKVASAGAAMKSTCEMFGAQSTISFNNRMPFMFWGEFFNPAGDDLADYGRPLMQKVALSTLSGGFVLCENPHIAIPAAFASEVTAIENALATGVYLE